MLIFYTDAQALCISNLKSIYATPLPIPFALKNIASGLIFLALAASNRTSISSSFYTTISSSRSLQYNSKGCLALLSFALKINSAMYVPFVVLAKPNLRGGLNGNRF